MSFYDYMMRSCVYRRSSNSTRHVVGWLSRAVHAPGGAGVRRHAARTNKGAGGSEGTRARVDMAAPVAISGDRSDSGVAGERETTGVTMCVEDD